MLTFENPKSKMEFVKENQFITENTIVFKENHIKKTTKPNNSKW